MRKQIVCLLCDSYLFGDVDGRKGRKGEGRGSI